MPVVLHLDQIRDLPVATLGAILSAILAGDATRRSGPDDITVADLTGLGVQDAALAELVTQRALAGGTR